MGIIGEVLAPALEAKENDISSFIWRGPRSKHAKQSEIRLVDATESQLKSFYAHCESMLNSTNTKNPGRNVLQDIIEEQTINCQAELLLRWLENEYMSTDRESYPRYVLLRNLSKAIEERSAVEKFSNGAINEKITKFVGGLPAEFQDLTVGKVIDACLGKLGVFDRTHLTNSFIFKLGLWFNKEEKKLVNEEMKATGKSRNQIIAEKCKLPSTHKIVINPDGVLTLTELQAMLSLKGGKKYSELHTDQLCLLSTKVLFLLKEAVASHAEKWKALEKQILLVAESKGYSI